MNSYTPFILLTFISTYALFGLTRMKYWFGGTIDGMPCSNIWWLLIGYAFYFLVFQSLQKYKKVYLYIIICIVGLILSHCVFADTSANILKIIYACIIYVCPIILFWAPNLNYKYANILLKLFILWGSIYALLSIFACLGGYSFLREMLGDNSQVDVSGNYVRAHLMLGSSITVSYFFNFMLPVLFAYLFVKMDCFNKKILIFCIILNFIATIAMGSRLAFICALLQIVSFFLISRIKFLHKVIIISVGCIVLICFILNIDIIYGLLPSNYASLKRIVNLLGNPTQAFATNSDSLRFAAMSGGIRIWKDNILLGIGSGTIFERLYNEKFISYNNMKFLIDPHNLYVLLLSEQGIIGLALFACLVILILRSFSLIIDPILRRIIYIFIFAILFDSIGGSQLMNEPYFSILFWICCNAFYKVIITWDKGYNK